MIQAKKIETLGRKVILLLALLAFMAPGVNAQDKRVSLTGREASLEELLKEIESQTGYIFGINHSTLNVHSKVSVAAGTATTAAVLNGVLDRIGQTYSLVGNHILIISRTPKADQKPATFVTTKNEPIVLKESELREIPLNLANDPAPAQPGSASAVAVANTATTSSSVASGPEYYEPDHIAGSKVVYTPTRPTAGAEYHGGLMRMYTRPVLGLKTDLLYGLGTLSPNIGLEVGLAPKWSFELMGSYNPWNLEGSETSNKKLVHWIVRGEGRYWLCERFNGHFFGVNAFVSQYNIAEHNIPLLFEKEYRYDGWAYSAGVTYGYHWMLSKHWGMEFSAGLGVIMLNYDKYECDRCANWKGKYDKFAFMPTRAGISLVYLIK
ncbi:hypothetical protein FACS1894159_05160 [Bacteroidia bacterium]|nr:hypothetical protein FACS1894159_05160 [Bacteroidia bacterium]